MVEKEQEFKSGKEIREEKERKKKNKKHRRGKFKRLKALKCFDNVYEMLCSGYPLSGIATYIQKDAKEYTDVRRVTLIEALKCYRRTLAPGDLIHSTLPRVFLKAERKFSDKLKELERLEDLTRMMFYRLDVAHAEERMGRNTDASVDKIARELRETIMRMHQVKMDLGLVGSRDLGTITVSAEKIDEIREKYGDGAASAFANPVSRGRVLAALGAIRKVSDIKGEKAHEIKRRMGIEEDDEKVIEAEFKEVEKDEYEEDEIDEREDEENVEGRDEENGEMQEREEQPRVGKIDGFTHKKEPPIINNIGGSLPPGPEKPGIKRRR